MLEKDRVAILPGQTAEATIQGFSGQVRQKKQREDETTMFTKSFN